MLDWLVVLLLMKGELNFATIMPGALFVTTAGVHLMLMLCVDNLDIRIRVGDLNYVP